jgi:hypothetical protein
MRQTPMILIGRAQQQAAIGLWCGTRLTLDNELFRWGDKKEMGAWVVNAPKFAVPLEALAAGTPPSVGGVTSPAVQEFPVSLARLLIAAYPGVADTIGDPTMAHGTVGAAAAELGRNFVGYEYRADQFDYAKRLLGA